VKVSEWDPITDTYVTRLENSVLLDTIGRRQGLSREEIMQEVARREEIMTFLIKSGLNSQEDVARTLVNYSQFKSRRKYATTVTPNQQVFKVN
jgi:hypothetical protein